MAGSLIARAKGVLSVPSIMAATGELKPQTSAQRQPPSTVEEKPSFWKVWLIPAGVLVGGVILVTRFIK